MRIVLKALLSISLIANINYAEPELTNYGEEVKEICQESFKIAKATYYSDDPLFTPLPNYLTFPKIVLPEDIESKILLEALSNYRYTDVAFDKDFVISKSSEPNHVFILKIDGESQLLLHVQPFNWRASFFNLFFVKQNLDIDTFSSSVSNFIENNQLKSLFADDFKPPIILQHVPSKKIWIIKMVEGGWKTYDAQGQSIECPVSLWNGQLSYPWNFDSSSTYKGKNFSSILKLYINALDIALGISDLRRGSQDFVAETREGAYRNVFNVINRPWVIQQGYNSMDVIKQGLDDWARKSLEDQIILTIIKDYYPYVKETLASYYMEKFKLNPRDAKEFSDFAMQSMISNFFVFPHNYGTKDSKWRSTEPKQVNPFRSYQKITEFPFQYYVQEALKISNKIEKKITSYYLEHGAFPLTELHSYYHQPSSQSY